MIQTKSVKKDDTYYMNSDWFFKTEELKFATIKYLQIGRLPHKIKLVVQDGYKTAKFNKYASFSKSGRLILIGAGNTKTEAKKKTLHEINIRLREVALYNHNAKTEDFLNKLKEFQ